MCNGSSSFLSARGLFWSNYPCFPYIKVFTKPTLKTNKAPNENKLKTKTKHHRDYLSLVNKSSSYNQGEHKLKEILQKRRKTYCNNFNIQTAIAIIKQPKKLLLCVGFCYFF